MLYLSVGLSGPVADWCDAALAHLSALEGARAARFDGRGPALENAALALVRGNADSLAFAVRHLDADLLALLRQSGAPFLLALDDPREMVGGGDIAINLRAVANLCPLLMQLADLPNALSIGVSLAAGAPRDALARIAGHFGFRAGPADIERIAAAMPAVVRAAQPKSDVIQGALGSYADYFEGRALGGFVWQQLLFVRTADLGKPLFEPVRLRDVLNGRFLVHGPYLKLPPGNWSATLAMTISPDGKGQTLAIDVFCKKVLDTVWCLTQPGDFRTPELNFTITDADTPVEIRIMIEREGAPGDLLLHYANLRRRAGAPAAG